MSASSSSSRIPLFQVIDDSIIKNINNHNYPVSLLHLEQLLHEDGFLSHVNQIRHAQCLYYCKRYTESIEVAQRYIGSGNTSSDLQYIIGLSLYKLGQFYEAANIFRFNPRWELWYKKSYIMSAYSQCTVYTKKYEFPEKIENPTDWSQTKSTITITFPYAGLMVDDVSIDFYFESIDISIYKDEKQSFNQTLELYDAILPYSCSYEISATKLILKLTKVKEGDWPELLDPNDLRNKSFPVEEEIEKVIPHTKKLFESAGIRSISKCKKAQIQMLGPPETRVKRFLLKEEEEDENL
ncbi:Suppressor of G2 allele of SKP1 [Tritrichomonas musculus]|uniref:Suppressor of G2 allele of SKP1 n=1 Tax=Tritrichomonas musculus TaxID=1915356 RepID=A0ABR2KZH3_9EUKA